MPLAENAVYFFHFVALCLVWPYLPLFLRYDVRGGARPLARRDAPRRRLRLAGLGLARRHEVRPRAHLRFVLALLAITHAPGLGRGADAGLALVLLARSVFEAPLIPFVDAGVVARASFGASRLHGSLSWGLTAPVAGYAYAHGGFAPCVAAALLRLRRRGVCR